MKKRRNKPLAVVALILSLGTALAVGLTTPKAAPPELVAQPMDFPHAPHIAADVDCLQCHAWIMDKEEPRTPTFEMCMECHEDPSSETKKSAKLDKLRELAAATPEGRFNSIFFVRYVDFPHDRHAKEATKEECLACHPNTAKSLTLPRAREHWVHNNCWSCHLKQPAASAAHNATRKDCMSCHV